MRRRLLVGILLTGAAITGTAAAALTTPCIEAEGDIAGEPLHGPVDGELARAYLAGEPLPTPLAELRKRAGRGRVPSAAELGELTERYSTDVATLLWLEAVEATPEATAVRTRFDAELSFVREHGVDTARPDVPEDLLVLLVPGWFYDSHGHETNADYHVQRDILTRWKVPHRLAPIDENGAAEDNARVVANEIRRASAAHRLIVVSASKSGGEVARALGSVLAPDETRSVVAWLSIGGVVRGSPLADRVLSPAVCWLTRTKFALEGFDLVGAMSMTTPGARAAFDDAHIPEHIRIVSYIPVPLSGNITERGALGYATMRPLGPNDGLTMLSDQLIDGAEPLLHPGADHFLMSDDMKARSVALLRLLLTR